MGDNRRRRGSVRDVVDEDLPRYSDKGRYSEYSALPQTNLPRPRHDSRLSSWEEKGDTIVTDKVDMAETRERSHNSGYYRSMSPDFGGSDQRKWSNAPDKQRSQSRRYGERRRSRSRGLEKSRSRSPGYGRGRNHARDRSRSRSKGSIRGHSRSRSPYYDQGSEPNRWSDGKNARGRSSQTCNDFVVGMCRRGSQCRFLHSDNVLRDGESLDSDIAGRSKGKQEPGRGSKYHYDKIADKFSDGYSRDNDHSRNRPRGAIVCRDFVKGNCRYEESCRFSHSAEDGSADRSYRNVQIDPDHRLNSNKVASNLCKFFLAGNCRRDNCRFTHDTPLTPLSSEVEDRIHNKSGGETVGTLEEWKGPLWDEPEKAPNTRKISKWGAPLSSEVEDRIDNKSGGETVGMSEEWKGPLWDDPEKPANTRKMSNWGASVDADMELSEDVSVDRRGDERWGSSLEDKTRFWEHDNQFLDRDNYVSNSRTNDEDSRRTYAAETMVIENSLGEPQERQAHEEFSSHGVDKLAHIPNHNLGGEVFQHDLSSPSANPHVSMISDAHPCQGMEEHNRGPVLESGGLYELNDCRNVNEQNVNPEIRSSSCDNSSLLNMNGQQIDLNESGHVVFPPDLNEPINRKHSITEHMPEPSALSSFSVQPPNAQYAPHNTLPIPAVDVAKSSLGEFQTQLQTVLEPSTSMEIAPSQSLLHPLPADCPQSVSNSIRSLNQHPVLKHETDYTANDQKARELLSSLSMIDSQLSTLRQIGDSKVEGNNVLKENLHEATKELEVNDSVEKCNISSKMEADTYCSNRADDPGKEEGGNNNKDEKVIRLFKNALVELVKDILKPKWKEGKMSREVHKTVVKKVVDKVTVTIQAEHVPNTQEKVEQYLSANRPKISKLVQAYVERSLKAGS